MYSDTNFLQAWNHGFPRARVILYRPDELFVLKRDFNALDHDDATSKFSTLILKGLDKQTMTLCTRLRC